MFYYNLNEIAYHYSYIIEKLITELLCMACGYPQIVSLSYVYMSLQTSGRSAVFYAAEEGDLEVVKLLIQGGASLSLKDKV